MTEQRNRIPRRDAEGRVLTLGDLLGVSLAGWVVGVLALATLDLGFTSLSSGEFGQANGWLAVILPAWLYWDDFRAWGFGAARVAAGLAAGAVGLTLGLVVAGFTADLPPVVSGGLGAAAFTVGYAVVWFHGVRWLARRTG